MPIRRGALNVLLLIGLLTSTSGLMGSCDSCDFGNACSETASSSSDAADAESLRGENELNNDVRRLFVGTCTVGDRSFADGTRCTAEMGLSVSESVSSFSDAADAESLRGEKELNKDARRLFVGTCTVGDRSSADGTRCTSEEMDPSFSASEVACSDAAGAES